MIFTRPAVAVMIFTSSRNAAASDNSMYCMIPDPFPSSAFGKGSATPDYRTCRERELSKTKRALGRSGSSLRRPNRTSSFLVV